MPIEVKNLTHVYMPGTPFETKALDDVSIIINDGDFLGLIGHTGSGKSTLIQHFNGLMKPMSGQVLIDGEDISQPGVKLMAIRRKVGLVFQYPEYQLFEETVEKDIAFGPKNLGLSESEISQRVREAMDMVKLPYSLAGKSPFELSGGQKRRAAIAGVLAMKPDTLVMDEPAAGLDPAGRADMRRLIRGIHSSGATVVMVSHAMDDVAKLCGRIAVMSRGRIVLNDTPARVFENSGLLKELRLGLPAAALLRDELNARGFDVPADVYTTDAMFDYLTSHLRLNADFERDAHGEE